MKKIFVDRRGYFDERERDIRNRVFAHGFFLLVALLFIDNFLEIFEVRWAEERQGNLVIVGAAFFLVCLELIFRNAYFSRKQMPFTLTGRLVCMLLWTAIWGFNVNLSIRIDEIVAQGQLTMQGCTMVLQASLALVGVCGTVKAAIDLWQSRRQKKKGEKE